MKTRIKEKALVLFLFANAFLVSLIAADLYLFTKDKEIFELKRKQQQDTQKQEQYANSEYVPKPDADDKLYLFPDSQYCVNNFDLDAYLKTNDKTTFCTQHCLEILKDGSRNKNGSTDGHHINGENKNTLSLYGALHYYRSFVHAFINQLDYHDIVEDDLHFKLNIELTKQQIEKLKKFSNSIDENEASMTIQDTTNILENMFKHSDYYKPNSYWENVKDFLFSFNFTQYTFVILILTTSLFVMVLHNYGIKRFTYKNLIATLILVAFVSSVINNHLILNQKKQILRQLKLKEIVPEECFAVNNVETNAVNDDSKANRKNQGIFSTIYSRIKRYVSHSPTSKTCVDYHEALFINSYQSNIAETVVYTVFESIRPIALAFGEFINQFHVALVKDLSFYQAIPLIVLVTIIMIPLMIYLISFVFLLFFNYEFNFFHLISLKKSKTTKTTKSEISHLEIEQIKMSMIKQRKEMAKVLGMIRKENEKIMIKCKSETGNPTSQMRLESLTYTETVPFGEPIDLESDTSADNMSQLLDRTLETLFENINNKESDYNDQLAMLARENENLRRNLEAKRSPVRLLEGQATLVSTQAIRKNSNIQPLTRPMRELTNTNVQPQHLSYQHHQHYQQQQLQQQKQVSPCRDAQPIQASLTTLTQTLDVGERSETDYTEIKSPGRQKNCEKYLIRKPNSVLIDSIESSTERIFQNGSPSMKSEEKKSKFHDNDDDEDDDDEDDEDEDIYVILEDK